MNNVLIHQFNHIISCVFQFQKADRDLDYLSRKLDAEFAHKIDDEGNLCKVSRRRSWSLIPSVNMVFDNWERRSENEN